MRPQTKPPGRLHYDLVTSANDAICKPLVALYNSMLREAVAALKSQTMTSRRFFPTKSDFEALRRDDDARFVALAANTGLEQHHPDWNSLGNKVDCSNKKIERADVIPAKPRA